jgi:hypothetical protein
MVYFGEEESEMTVSVHLPIEDERRLALKAETAGVDLQTYVERIVHGAAARPPIEELLRPVRDAFHATGMTDDELGELLENAKHEMRAER